MGFRDHGPLEVVWEMLDVYVFFFPFLIFLGERFGIAVIVVQWLWS